MSLIRWIFSLAVLSIWAAFIGTALYVALYSLPEDAPEAAAIVVLGGSADEVGTGLGQQTAARLETGLNLYKEGAAQVLVLSGGGDPAVADIMRNAAIAADVPSDAILVENKSLSTLQNALFASDFERLDKAAPIILVTHKYHLPRANASFRWAGFSDVKSYAADADTGFSFSQGLLWESVKWPANVVRAAAASAAKAGSVPRNSYIKYLE